MTSLKLFFAIAVITFCANISYSQTMVGPMPEGQQRPTDVSPESLVGHGFVLAVNGDAISSYDIIEKVKAELLKLADKDYRGFYTLAGPIVQSETMKEIYDLLMYQYALQDLQKNDSGEQMLQAAREKYRKNVIRRYSGNQAVTHLELEKMGTSMEEMLDKYQRRLVISSYKDVSFSSDQTISRLEIIDYYDQNIENYTIDAQLQFSLIQVGSKQEAEDILAELKADADFSELAKSKSKGWRAKYGGLWEPVEPGSIRKMYKPVVTQLVGLEPGGTTGIIKSEDKYFIARLESYSPVQHMQLAEVQDQIRSEINELRWGEYTQKLSKKLLERAVIGDVDAFVAGTVYTSWKKFGMQQETENN